MCAKVDPKMIIKQWRIIVLKENSMTHKRSFVPLNQVGIYGPPDTLYQGGYFKVSWIQLHQYFHFFWRHSTQIRCFFIYINEKRLQWAFSRSSIVKPFLVFVFSMFVSCRLYILPLVPLYDDTSCVFSYEKLYVNGLIINSTVRVLPPRELYVCDNDLYLFTREGRNKNTLTIPVFVLCFLSRKLLIFSSFSDVFHYSLRTCSERKKNLEQASTQEKERRKKRGKDFPKPKRACDEKSIQK